MTWEQLMADQLDFYLQVHLLPRLDGLDDDEYRWRPDGPADATAAAQAPTLEWRLNHVAVSNLGTRVSAFFGDGSVPAGVDMFDPRHEPPAPASADEGVALLQAMGERWRDGIAALSDEQLLAPLGPVGGGFAEDPMAALALHVNRETMHHGGEICLLRDLYAVRGSG